MSLEKRLQCTFQTNHASYYLKRPTGLAPKWKRTQQPKNRSQSRNYWKTRMLPSASVSTKNVKCLNRQ